MLQYSEELTLKPDPLRLLSRPHVATLRRMSWKFTWLVFVLIKALGPVIR